MDQNKRIEYIRTKLEAKGINQETQDYIITYVNMNQSLFGSILDMDRVTDRIVDNLHHSILAYDIKTNPSKGLVKLFSSRGFWDSYEHKIETNPVHKLISRISKKAKEQYNSTMMHEIDHCATTVYMDVSRYFNISKEELNQTVEMNGTGKAFEQIQNRYGGKIPVSGFSGLVLGSQHNKNGLKRSNFTMLNEGITAYKQEMYDNFLGIKSKTNYVEAKLVAKLIAKAIGMEQLISMHFNNDYDGMKLAFQEKNGQDLDRLVSELKPSSCIKSKLFGKFHTRHCEKKLKDIEMQSNPNRHSM